MVSDDPQDQPRGGSGPLLSITRSGHDGEVSRFGFVRGVGASTAADPRTNLTGDPYVTDGLRLVVFLGAQRRPFNEIEFLEWEGSPP